MPSLHFGYSLLIGVTIMSIPLSPGHRRGKSLPLPFFNQSHPALAPRIHLPSGRRLLCIILGFLYPLVLIAIISTANHFVLDTVAGAVVCAFGWWGNAVLLNLLPVEDYFLWILRISLTRTQSRQRSRGAGWDRPPGRRCRGRPFDGIIACMIRRSIISSNASLRTYFGAGADART